MAGSRIRKMGTKRRDNSFNSTATENMVSWYNYYEQLKGIAISRFKWGNLPSTIDERFMEKICFENGSILFFEEKELGFLALPFASSGSDMNVYGEPNTRRATSMTQFQTVKTASDSVIIYDNYVHTSQDIMLQSFARRLYEVDRTIDVNIIGQKTPFLITCPEEQRLTMANVYQQYVGNKPVIFACNGIDLNSIKVMQTNAPYVADKLFVMKQNIWNEAMTMLGIANTNISKRERLISDEVGRGMGGTLACRRNALGMRKIACDKINEMFGLNVTVEYDDGVELLMRSQETADEVDLELGTEEGGENG